MDRPDPYRSAALAASNALSALAATRAALAHPGLMGRGARLVLDQDRTNAIGALEYLAGLRIEIDGAPYQATPDGAQLLAENVRNGRDEAMHMPAQTLRNWAEQPSATEEPWILVDVGDRYPYWAGMDRGENQGWTSDLSKAERRTLATDWDGDRGAASTEVVPLSRAEATAYPNGKPGAPRGEAGTVNGPIHAASTWGALGDALEAPAAAMPASTPPVAEAAQEPTAGERIAAEIWDGATFRRAEGVPLFGAKIDAAIREAVADATRTADAHVREVEAERDALRKDLAASQSLVVSLNESIRGIAGIRDDHSRRADNAERKLYELRGDLAALSGKYSFAEDKKGT